ncbi:hypothetical protein JW960_08870 [candidate division KSB1 bacterium]|nr:hypothetical protein [candidate division KSB1 bacterium]
MSTSTYKISLNYDQILQVVRQLSPREKIRLTKELAKETIDYKLSDFLNSFETDELTDELIDNEVDVVREELYAKKKNKPGNN